MYSDKDFQTFWFRYKTEGEPHGISINSFCVNQGVPYKQFYAWFKKHAKDTVIPVEIEGMPDNEDEDDGKTNSKSSVKAKSEKTKSKGGILVTIQTSEIIRNTYHRDPLNGDVYIYFSRDRRTIRLFQYKHHAFDLHERTFNNEYRFKQVVLRDGIPTYKMDWKTVAVVLESPVVKQIRL